MAGGVVANFGSMTKPLHAGRAAEGGIEAAELAQAGLDGVARCAGWRGRPPAGAGRSGQCRMDDAPCGADLETTLLRVRPGIKKYPVCYAAHRVVDGVLDLVRRPPHRAGGSHLGAMRPSARPRPACCASTNPRSVDAGALQHGVRAAAAIARGRLGIAEVSPATLHDPVVRATDAAASAPHTVQTSCPLEPSFAYTDRVTVTLRDGTLLDSGPIRFARGHAELPLDEAQLLEKLHGCAQPHERALADAVVARVTAALEHGRLMKREWPASGLRRLRRGRRGTAIAQRGAEAGRLLLQGSREPRFHGRAEARVGQGDAQRGDHPRSC